MVGSLLIGMSATSNVSNTNIRCEYCDQHGAQYRETAALLALGSLLQLRACSHNLRTSSSFVQGEPALLDTPLLLHSYVAVYSTQVSLPRLLPLPLYLSLSMFIFSLNTLH